MQKTFYIENLGCAKNQVDAEVMLATLIQAGRTPVDSPDLAEFIIVNSCGFIEPAKEESIQVTLELCRQYPQAKVVMAGCLSQRYADALFSEMPELAGVFGNRDPEAIVPMLERIDAEGRVVYLPGDEQWKDTARPLPLRRRLFSAPGSAYVKVAEGCNNRCAFCAIPLIRGNLRSRSQGQVIGEIRSLLDSGVFEINLVAHDLSSFGRDRANDNSAGGELLSLLSGISRLSGDFWIRLLYLYPETFPLELLSLVQADKRFLAYFDLPVQHASDRILAAMGRRGRRASNLELVHRLREAAPSVVLRSTFLVGFPGETAEDFRELEQFQKEAQFDWLGVFGYSAEEGTTAYRHLQRRDAGYAAVPPATIVRRKQALEAAQVAITETRLERFVGTSMKLLVEERVEGESMAIARGYPHAPEVDGLVVVHGTDLEPGTTVVAQITRRNGFDLEAVASRRLAENQRHQASPTP